ncbi:MAG: hypothetical protein AAB351_02505 [Patescibacteria group bacterium]
MRKEKEKAFKLRLAGNSYAEITKKLNVPKSTLSFWFSEMPLSEKARKRISLRVQAGSFKGLLKRNQLQTHLARQRAKETRSVSKLDVGTLSKRELFILGVGLYWAEGYKRQIYKDGKAKTYHPVSLSNSDPNLVKIFLRFLREVCGASSEKITAHLRIYEHQNEKELLKFWSQVTKIAPSRFSKFYYGVSKSSQHKRPFNILPYGTIQIRINDTKLYHQIMGWIEGLEEQK